MKAIRILVCCDPNKEKCCRVEEAKEAFQCMKQFLKDSLPSDQPWTLQLSPCLGKCEKGPIAYVETEDRWIKKISPEKLESKREKILKKLGF